MGVVFEGEQVSPRRAVALKVIRGGPYVDSYRVRLFEREAQTLGRLKHPAIAAIYEGGRTSDGQPYFAMELVNGLPLIDYAREKRLSRRQRIELFRRVCDAINYAHQRGVIHRDLKPSNILVDTEGQPKILDFGLARIIDPDSNDATLTRDAGRVLGTLPYMSPEEARGDVSNIDVRADVYSLGVIFYELLTHRLPYTVSRLALPEAVRIICEQPPARPSSLDRSLRGDLETMALKALEKEPGRRFQTVAEFDGDLERHLASLPIRARRGSAWYRVRKFVVRNQIFLAVLALVASIIVAAGLYVRQAEFYLQSGTQLNLDLQDLRVARSEFRLAEEHEALGHLDKAEREYRASMVALERLERFDEAARARLRLALLLVRWARSGDDQEAENHLLELRDYFGESPALWRAELIEVLRALVDLLGEDRLDRPEEAVEFETELARLEAFREPVRTVRPAG